MPSNKRAVTVRINGQEHEGLIEPRKLLVDFIREDASLTGTHIGCEHGICGACHIVIGGRVVRGCLMLAAQADGEVIETIEGATATGRVKVLQDAFFERAALQCGFCTPGMILQSAELLEQNPSPTRDEIREGLSGNYCRCTGYHAIVDAVAMAAQRIQGDPQA